MDGGIAIENPELDLLKLNKQDGYNYRERRQEDWKENYLLYRDKVTVNRLTQRQSVNLPIMKQQIRTLLKDVDDMPVLYFENLDNDKQAELFANEYWNYTGECNNFELKDIQDKKQAFFFGRTFDQWQIVNGKVHMKIIDPEDMLVSRYVDPSDIDSSRFLIHTHIFVPLATLSYNMDYDKKAVNQLTSFYASEQGLIKSAENARSLAEKNQRMSELELSDVDSPVLGETYVELSLHFVYRKEEEDEEEQIYLFVEADDMVILMKKRLEEVIGETSDHYWRNHYPYNSWADDVDAQDFWTDGIADMIRTPNKVVNSWFSQDVENRTLRNMGMNYYDSSMEGFVPQTYQPRAFGWYGIPVPADKKLDDVIKKVDIPSLQGNLEGINFIIGVTERATGATAAQQGDTEQRQVTLGEVQLALGEAKERIKGMSKFYTHAWKKRGEKFLKLIEAASDQLEPVKLFKKGRNTDHIYAREVKPDDWRTPLGYRVKIWSQDEKNAKDMENVEKLQAVTSAIPNNPKLTEIFQRKLLEIADLTPDQMNEVIEYEKRKQQALQNAAINQPTMGGGMPTDPAMGTPQPSLPQPQQPVVA